MYIISCVFDPAGGWRVRECWRYHGKTPPAVRLVTFHRRRQIWLNSVIYLWPKCPCTPLTLLKSWQRCKRLGVREDPRIKASVEIPGDCQPIKRIAA